MRLPKDHVEVEKMMILADELQRKHPEEIDVIVGATFATIADEAVKLITNVHELVQLQKVLNNSIDACPTLKSKITAKVLVEFILYHKEV